MTASVGTTKPAAARTPREHTGIDAACWRYRAFGLSISSQIPLPELVETERADSDITIVRGKQLHVPAASGRQPSFEFRPELIVLHWEGVATFAVTRSHVIEVEPAPGVSDDLVALPLLGTVLALVLHMRGLLVLHASAVAVAGEGVAFLGDKGAGKSTLAGKLVSAGHGFVTDDVLALNFGRSRPVCEPAYPQLKLTRDAADAVSIAGATVRRRPHQALRKWQHGLADGYCAKAVPVAGLFVLKRGDEAAIDRLPYERALPALMQFTYATRFGRAAFPLDQARRHFHQCGALLATIGVHQLTVPRSLDCLDEVVALVNRHLAAG